MIYPLLIWLGAGFIAIAGAAWLPIAVVVGFGGVFRVGMQRGRARLGNGLGWLGHVGPDALERATPLILAAAAIAATLGTSTLLYLAVTLAAWNLGHRAGWAGFGPRDYARDLAFGPTGRLVAAAIGAGLLVHATGTVLIVAESVIVASCAMIALREEPLPASASNVLAASSDPSIIKPPPRAAKVP